MTILGLLEQIRASGAECTLSGDSIVLSGSSNLTEEMISWIRGYKLLLIEVLERENRVFDTEIARIEYMGLGDQMLSLELVSAEYAEIMLRWKATVKIAYDSRDWRKLHKAIGLCELELIAPSAPWNQKWEIVR